jgi:hypothetical protein
MDADGTNQRPLDVPAGLTEGDPKLVTRRRTISFDCSSERPVICAIHPEGTGFTWLFGRASFPYWID